jgi:hypothetical protein
MNVVQVIKKIKTNNLNRKSELEDEIFEMYAWKEFEEEAGEKTPAMKELDSVFNYEDSVIKNNCDYMEILDRQEKELIKKILSI